MCIPRFCQSCEATEDDNAKDTGGAAKKPVGDRLGAGRREGLCL